MSFLTSLTLNRVDVVVIDVFRECLDLMLAEFSLRAAEDSSLCKCKCKCKCVFVSLCARVSAFVCLCVCNIDGTISVFSDAE